jgi:hypothetical protein
MKTDTHTHTPGPWRVENWIYQNAREVVTIQTDKDAIATACNIWRDGDDSTFEVIANARLIASAPDLLAALKDAEALLFLLGKEHEETGGIDYNADFIAGTRNELLLSIAKAEGRDS